MHALGTPSNSMAQVRATASRNGRLAAVPPLAARRQRAAVRPRAQGEPGVSEDVIARLRAAEEEAARLKQELAAAQAAVRRGQAALSSHLSVACRWLAELLHPRLPARP